MDIPVNAEQANQTGLKLLGQGKAAEAEELFWLALRERADWAEAHNNLGAALAARNRYEEALACFARAVEREPAHPDWRHNLANALRVAGKAREAMAHDQEAARLRPGWSDLHHNHGMALRAAGELQPALEQFRTALGIDPDHPHARNSLGVTLCDLKLYDEAAAAYRQVLRLRPNMAETHNNLGVNLVLMGKHAEAAACYRQALALNPRYAEAHSNLGNALRHLDQLDEAIASLREAVRLKPDYADAYNNLAIALVKLERMDEAVVNYREALRLKPDYPDARKNLGMALLGTGNFAEGWPYWEWRWHGRDAAPRKFAQPRWDGGPLDGKTILLYWEQGLGDTIQFIRYAAVVERLGGKVVVECQKALLALFARCAGIFRLVGAGDKLPEFDVQAPLMSVPGIIAGTRGGGARGEENAGTQVALADRGDGLGNEEAVSANVVPSPPAPLPHGERGEMDPHPRPLSRGERGEVPYLSAEPERVRRWGQQLKGITGFKIGIAWQGSPTYGEDKFRSIRLAHFEPVAQVKGTRLISLQKGFGEEQLAEVGAAWKIVSFGKKLDETPPHPQPLSPGGARGEVVGGAFLDTAAIMKHLDLFITSDTAIAHVAGALGVPVWLALPKAPDWRWQLEGEDNPWYPTMRIFRQKKRGDWREVFERIAHALETLPPLENAERYAQRGLLLLNQNQGAGAAALLQRGIELDPKNAVMHHHLARALEKQAKNEEALAAYREAVCLKADYADALLNLGDLLRRLKRFAEAEEVYRRAMKIAPNSPDLCNHLGIALVWQGKHAEAEASLRRCLRLKPTDADGHNNLGVVLEQVGRLVEATECYQEATRLMPDNVDMHRNLALTLLMRGEYLKGWAEYEARLKAPGVRKFQQPRYDGRALEGQAVLVWVEQGLGDTLQMVRYGQWIQRRGGVVYLAAPGSLKRLFARCPWVDRFIPQGAPLPEFAFQVPTMSLPAVFQTTLEDVPASVPYLSAEPALIDEWAEALAQARCECSTDAPEWNIGIAWQGSQIYGGDRHRSIPLAEFEPVPRIPGVRLVSLQKGFGSEQLQAVPAHWNIVDFGNRLDAQAAFVDTAALMANLDLVITSDTAVAHLAGALGVPVWLPLSQAADWRWLREGDATPWYPTMRLFRQKRWGDWREVFERIAHELKQMPSGLRAPLPLGTTPHELQDKIAMLRVQRSRYQEGGKLHDIHRQLGVLLAARARSLKPDRGSDVLAPAYQRGSSLPVMIAQYAEV